MAAKCNVVLNLAGDNPNYLFCSSRSLHSSYSQNAQEEISTAIGDGHYMTTFKTVNGTSHVKLQSIERQITLFC